jgi:amino acid transporter
MGHLASAFPTAGGLYHWAAILGGRGWGWTTAWFNLAGLVTVLAAINVGTFQFAANAFAPEAASQPWAQLIAVSLITFSQALVNHLGIRVTRVLTDFSGYWILLVATVLTIALLSGASSFDLSRLVTFDNFSGMPEGSPVWPKSTSLVWLFALGMLLPAYTVTGFDASAHAAEETIGAAERVPRAILRSVWVSGLFGWMMLAAVVLAMPDLRLAAQQGDKAFVHTLFAATPKPLAMGLLLGAVLAQYLCGLATVTSASRMTFAFARDGGLPASALIRRVSPRFRTPAVAIWTATVASVLFTVYSPVYSTITAVCVIFLYVSYALPTVMGLLAYDRWWTVHGPWRLGRWYRPLAIVNLLACSGLIAIGMQPPNEKAFYALSAMVVWLALVWFLRARHVFPGPPQGVLSHQVRT